MFEQKTCDLVAAVTANAYFALVILMFVARMLGEKRIALALGLVSCAAILPLVYLMVSSFVLKREAFYFVWAGLMVLFLLFEIVVDHGLGVEFRKVRWQTIAYVMFFCGATGGMIGMASKAGRGWMAVTVVSYLAMVSLSFVQRRLTGM
jgi:hypothetical protein